MSGQRHWRSVSLGEVHFARSSPGGEAVHIQVLVLPHWDYLAPYLGDGVDMAGRGVGENAYVQVHVQHPAAAVVA